MGWRGLSVVGAYERADHGHQHRHLNADEPCKVADLLFDRPHRTAGSSVPVIRRSGGLPARTDGRPFRNSAVDLFEPTVRRGPPVRTGGRSGRTARSSDPVGRASVPRRSDAFMACASTLASVRRGAPRESACRSFAFPGHDDPIVHRLPEHEACPVCRDPKTLGYSGLQ